LSTVVAVPLEAALLHSKVETHGPAADEALWSARLEAIQ
jgi:hypothetical protein